MLAACGGEGRSSDTEKAVAAAKVAYAAAKKAGTDRARNGEASHFVELDPAGNLIRTQ